MIDMREICYNAFSASPRMLLDVDYIPSCYVPFRRMGLCRPYQAN